MRLEASFMISQEVFLKAEASYSTGLAGGFFTLKITKKQRTERRAAEALLSANKKYSNMKKKAVSKITLLQEPSEPSS